MDIIGTIILFTIAVTLFYIFLVIACIYVYFIKTFIFGNEGPAVDNSTAYKILNILKIISTTLTTPFIFILLFYFIFYFIYLFIITVIPPTGFATLFIPIRELLLKIPPLPQLQDYGVFRLIGKLFEIFKINSMFKKFINTNNALFEFSHDNIKRIAVFLFPSFEKNIDNFVNNLHPDTFKNDSENDTKKKELYKKIENDTNICIANNTIPIVPDINVADRVAIIYKNNLATVKCHASSIGSYVKTNY